MELLQVRVAQVLRAAGSLCLGPGALLEGLCVFNFVKTKQWLTLQLLKYCPKEETIVFNENYSQW